MTDTRVGIVGLGAQGSVYAELISGDMVPNMDLGAVCDGNPATRQLVESNSVRLANAIHISSWKGREVPFDFDDKDYLSELNKRIRDEGLFPERA